MAHIQAAMHHAGCRQAQRNLSNRDVHLSSTTADTFVLPVRCISSLGRRDIPKASDVARHFSHLEGTVLVVDDTAGVPVLITYRNRHGLKAIRLKTKYDRGAAILRSQPPAGHEWKETF